MSETRLDFSGNSEEAQRAIDKLVKKTAQLTEELRKMKAESRKGSDEAKQGHEQLVTTLGKAAASITSLGAIASKVYGGWSQRLDELKQKHEQLVPSLSKGLAESGRLDKAGDVQQWSAGLLGKGITREHSQQAFEGVARAGELDFSDQLAVAAEAAKFGKTKMDVGAFGGMMAELKKIAPEMTPDDLADTALSLKKQLGDKASVIGSDAFQRQMAGLKEAGITGKDAITYAGLAMGADEKGNALELLTKKGLSFEDRKDKKRIFNAQDFANMGGILEMDRQTNFGSQQLAATPGAMLAENAVNLLKDKAALKDGPAQSTLAKVQSAVQEGVEAKPGASNRVQAALDPILRTVDWGMRAAGMESAGSQAQSLAASAVSAGRLDANTAAALLAELKEQTNLMKQNAGRVNVDAHTE